MKAVEAFYSVRQLSALLNMSPGWIKARIAAGDFSGAVNLGEGKRGDLRVPASSVNEFLSRRLVRPEDSPVLARSVGELRRKSARAVSFSQNF